MIEANSENKTENKDSKRSLKNKILTGVAVGLVGLLGFMIGEENQARKSAPKNFSEIYTYSSKQQILISNYKDIEDSMVPGSFDYWAGASGWEILRVTRYGGYQIEWADSDGDKKVDRKEISFFGEIPRRVLLYEEDWEGDLEIEEKRKIFRNKIPFENVLSK